MFDLVTYLYVFLYINKTLIFVKKKVRSPKISHVWSSLKLNPTLQYKTNSHFIFFYTPGVRYSLPVTVLMSSSASHDDFFRIFSGGL